MVTKNQHEWWENTEMFQKTWKYIQKIFSPLGIPSLSSLSGSVAHDFVSKISIARVSLNCTSFA